MKLRAILQDSELSGLTKGFVYYLEAQAHIKPTQTQQGQVKRRDYSPDDLRVIKQMWTYNKIGISPARAAKLLDRAPPEIPKASFHQSLLAFVLLIYKPAPPAKETTKILKALKNIRGVQEVAGVYGTVDVIVKAEVDNLASLYTLVHTQITRATGLKETRTGTLIVIDPQFHWDRSKDRTITNKTFAFILLQADHTYDILNKLKDFHEVLEAGVIYGEDVDIVAKIAVKDLAELTTFSRQKLPTLPGIGKVTTFVVSDPTYHVHA